MEKEIKIPSVGESIQEALLAEWFKKDGDLVKKDEPLFVIETDKVTLEIEAEADGVLKIKVEAGKTVSIGQVVGTIDTEAVEKSQSEREEKDKEKTTEKDKDEKPATGKEDDDKDRLKKEEEIEEKPVEEPQKEAPDSEKKQQPLSPAVRRLVSEKKVDVDKIEGTGPGGKVTKSDVMLYLESQEPEKATSSEDKEDDSPGTAPEDTADEAIERKPMSPIRRRIASRLLESKQNTAMLTTFNEIDMSRVMNIRSRFKDHFKDTHGVALGFMSFFIKACVGALKEFPEINAFIENNDMVYHKYYHIGVAIGTAKGLVVPVIKHADRLSYKEIEKAIVKFADKIKEKRLDVSDMEGGTFTITNGGVFGSLLSTPILNYPQSGILGMHKIEKRPVVVDDEIVIRPMMYVALSYDHRIVDGREAVTFLRKIKELIEDPEKIMLEI